MNSTVRWVLVVAGIAGVLFSAVGFFDMIDVIRTNGVTDGEPVGLRTHYLQLGRFYTRGFTTGFFLCFSLMLVAIAVGTLYDEKRRQKREGMAAASRLARRIDERALLPDEDESRPGSQPH
jgi:hypothetical protein